MSVNKAIVVGNLGRDPEVRALPSGQSVASFSALGTMLIVKLWFLPLLMSAEAAHFLIELPEHLGCDKTTRNVLQNTRTIVGSRFSRWLTNCNNLHVEHHIFPTLAMKYLVKVHEKTSPYCHYLEQSYLDFYCNVVRGYYLNPQTPSESSLKGQSNGQRKI